MDIITYVLKRKEELSEIEKNKVEQFVLSEETNGEFINSFKFLEYHPKERFKDDSVVVLEAKSGRIVGCMMAAQSDSGAVISHPGTTFAGPILYNRMNIKQKKEILDIILDYYESTYKRVELKLPPSCYSFQSNDTIPYFLMQRGYGCGMTALANVINISNIFTEEDVVKLFSSKRRNQVKKAIKDNIFYLKDEHEISRDVWCHLESTIEKKFGAKTTHTFEEIQNLRARFPDKILPFYIYTHDEKYGAFALVFCFKNIIHTQYLDVNYEMSVNYPNLLLIHKLILEARKLGYRYFSFGASTENKGKILNYGLYNYKAEYGGGDIILPLYVKGEKRENEK